MDARGPDPVRYLAVFNGDGDASPLASGSASPRPRCPSPLAIPVKGLVHRQFLTVSFAPPEQEESHPPGD
jgi:hypothetical protein